MLKRKFYSRLALLIVLIVGCFVPPPVRAQTIPGTTIPLSVTHLVISNQSGQPVTICVTLPASGLEDGCVSGSVGGLSAVNMINVTGGSYSGSLMPLTVYDPTDSPPVHGTFLINSGESWELLNTTSNPFPQNPPATQNCLQSITVTFGALAACPNVPNGFPTQSSPAPSIPNGVNQGEWTLNQPGTIGGVSGQPINDAIDITCVNGANSLLQMTLTSPPSGANPWDNGGGVIIGAGQSYTAVNSWVNFAQGCDNNCSPARPGVFPYGSTICNAFPDPAPPCPAPSQFCASQNGLPRGTLTCQFNRVPQGTTQTQQFGGTIAFTYLGPAIPPATCSTNPNPAPNPHHHQFPGMKCKVIKPIKNIAIKPKPFKLKEPRDKPIRFKDFKFKEPKPFKDFNKCIDIL